MRLPSSTKNSKPGQVRAGDVLKMYNADEDPSLWSDKDGNYVSTTDAAGDLPGLKDTDDRPTQQRRVTRIAKEIEKAWNYQFKWEDDIPMALAPPAGVSKWSWGLAWSFYKERFRTLKELCNRNFLLTEDVSPMTLWLMHLWFSAKHKALCHVFAVELMVDPKHPARVSFGKRKHYQTMRTGWSRPCPDSLSCFTEQRCNIVPESWVANLLRGNKPRAHTEEIMKAWTSVKIQDGFAGALVGQFEGIRMDDGEVNFSIAPAPGEGSVLPVGADVHNSPAIEADTSVNLNEDTLSVEPRPDDRDAKLQEYYAELKSRFDVNRIRPGEGKIVPLFREALLADLTTPRGLATVVNVVAAALDKFDESYWKVGSN